MGGGHHDRLVDERRVHNAAGHRARGAPRRLGEQRFELTLLHAVAENFVSHAHLLKPGLDLAHAVCACRRAARRGLARRRDALGGVRCGASCRGLAHLLPELCHVALDVLDRRMEALEKGHGKGCKGQIGLRDERLELLAWLEQLPGDAAPYTLGRNCEGFQLNCWTLGLI